MAISDWSIDAKGTEYVGVQDPDNGYNFQTLSEFTNSYRSGAAGQTHISPEGPPRPDRRWRSGVNFH